MINRFLGRDSYAERIVGRQWPSLVRQEHYRKSNLLMESAPDAPEMPTVA
jgi:hypothetical protein